MKRVFLIIGLLFSVMFLSAEDVITIASDMTHWKTPNLLMKYRDSDINEILPINDKIVKVCYAVGFVEYVKIGDKFKNPEGKEYKVSRFEYNRIFLDPIK